MFFSFLASFWYKFREIWLKNEWDIKVWSFSRNRLYKLRLATESGEPPEKKENIPSTLTEYTERWLTASGIFKGIFYYLAKYSLTTLTIPSVCQARACAWPCLGRLVTACGNLEIFSKNMGMFVGLSRPQWYIHTPQLSNYEKLLHSFGYVLINNIKIVVSHIGETFPEDEHSQARLGGYDSSTYQWVGFWFSIYIYIYICLVFSHKTYYNGFMFWNAMPNVFILRICI